jgi:Ca-activated chloride channel homolog
LAALCLAAPLLFSQVQQAAQPRPTAAPASDPTRPQSQPSLTIDRDPISSPDREEEESTKTPTATPSDRSHEVQRNQNGDYTLRQDVEEVLLNCTVIDEKGHAVEDLTRDDFRIWEDNAPQTANSFRHQDLPVSMGLLIDNSGSMLDKRAAVNAAAMNLLQQSNRQDSAFVVNFSDQAYLDQGFTSDLVALHRGLSHFESKGTTALYDAVAASADELSQHAKQPKEVLLIVSDGADNASRLGLPDAIREVQSLGGPVVYSIGLLYDTDSRESEKARTALSALSEETGGVAYFPRSLDQVNEIASDVARDIRNQYTIGYHSTKQASQGGYRVVHVEARSPHRGTLIVRTRHGYFAKPAQATQTAEQSPPRPK